MVILVLDSTTQPTYNRIRREWSFGNLMKESNKGEIKNLTIEFTNTKYHNVGSVRDYDSLVVYDFLIHHVLNSLSIEIHGLKFRYNTQRDK